MRKLFTWLLALAFATFHLVYVVKPFASARGIGEEVGWRLIAFDFPLIWLLEFAGLDNQINDSAFLWFITIAGTAMYASPGIILGHAIDRLRLRKRAQI